mgnify:FL=1
MSPLKIAFYGLKLGVQEVELAWEKWMGGADPQKMAEMRGGIVETRLALEEVGRAAIDAGKDIGNNIGDAIGEVGAIYEKAAEGLSKISVKANFESAKQTTATNKAAKMAGVQFAALNNQLKAEALEQEQIRDNELLSFEERYAAVDKLTEIIKKQNTAKKVKAQLEIDAAKAAFLSNQSDENTINLQKTKNDMMAVEADILATNNSLFEDRVTLNDEWNERLLEDAETEKEIAQNVSDFKKQLQADAIKALGSHIDASMSELEGNYSKEKRLAEANGQSTEVIDKKYEDKRKRLAGKQKIFKVAEAMITTYQMAALAYKDGLEAGGPAGIALGPIAAGIATLANDVRSI